MTAAQLAARMSVRPATVSSIESGEPLGATQLKTMERAAAAMGCEFVYALVPKESIEAMRLKQARELARARLAKVLHSMELEDQAPDKAAMRRHVELMAQEILLNGRLWDTDRAELVSTRDRTDTAER